MNKMDIAVGHVRSCANYEDARRMIGDPIKGMGFKLTKNEQILLMHYAKLFFYGK